MAWKPKTVAGKILKGALIAGGGVLGLATGAGAVGAVGGIAKGIGAVKGASKGIAGLVKVKDNLKEAAARLVTGNTKEQREILAEVRGEAKTSKQQLDFVEKLIAEGLSPEAARSRAGLTSSELKEVDGEQINKSGMFDFLQNKTVLYIAGALAGMYLLSKLGKR